MDTLYDDFPEVRYFFGNLPLRYGCFLISLFGLTVGLTGITVVFLYGIGILDVLLYYIAAPNETAKKATITTIALFSVLTTFKYAILMGGVVSKSRFLLLAYTTASLFMISVAFLIFIFAPISCFFGVRECLLDSFSWGSFMVAVVTFSICISVWTYFMILGNSLRIECL